MNSTIKPIAIGAGVFLVSLQSFHFDGMGSVFCFVGIILLASCAVLASFRASDFMLFPAFLMMVSIHWYFGLQGELRSYAGILLGAGSFAIGMNLLRNHRVDVQRGLTVAILIHGALWSAQAIVYFADVRYIDYVAMMSDAVSEFHSAKGFSLGGWWPVLFIPRFTGAFNEPGTLSGIMGAMIMARYALSRQVDWVFCAAIGMLLLTASTTGAALAFLACCIVAYISVTSASASTRRNILIVTAFAAVIPAAFLWRSVFNRLSWYTGGQDAMPTDSAVTNLVWVLSPENWTAFGARLSEIPPFVSIDYFGTWMHLLIQFGIFGLTVFLAPLLWLGGIAAAPYLAFLMAAKVKLTYPLIYFLLAVVVAESQRRRSAASLHQPN